MPYVPEAPRTNTPTSTDAELAERILQMEEGLAGPSNAGPSTKVPLTADTTPDTQSDTESASSVIDEGRRTKPFYLKFLLVQFF